MKQVVHIIRKAEIEKEYVKLLHLELDYELATLYDAVQENDSKQVEKSKTRLTEIHGELETFNAFA
ncbi:MULTISPECIES: hypothetical protein [Bacillales]|uniref:hypothetical protein n=1 Tax=Bacillales TaxID=1385 RepID=UPI00075906EE|nr:MULTISPECIES: hypothetical protein [Bacillales]MCM3638006.1 hypothetical protein [Sporosarcina luteola]MCM3710070.1 hypothetical protein [Sporosarcina luteola]MCM3742703.1 hypothetical protein [Sporosarcina luteola]HEX5564288.1 hypothetical protein [Sporosarcina sp.]